MSSINSATPAKNQTSRAIIELRKRFGDHPGRILSEFNPSKQVQYTRHIDRCYFGTAPSLGLIQRAYGRDTAESWLIIQLNNLSEFAGCREKLKEHQITELAEMIMEEYGYYKLTEFMLFFQNFKRGEYGKFYGAVDPMVIMQALKDFHTERWYAYEQRERKQDEERKARELREFNELKARYERRVPGAFTETAPLTFGQYRLMGYDTMDDQTLAQEIEALCNGTKKIPADCRQALGFLKQTGLTD